MKKKVSLVTTIALIVIAVAVTISITMVFAMTRFNNSISNITEKRVMLDYIGKTDELINEHYYGEVDQYQIRNFLVDGYLKGTEDKYAKFLSSEEHQKEATRLSGEWLSFGIEVAQTNAGELLVAYVHEGSPAGKAGVETGDVIKKVDGEDLVGKTTDFLTEKLYYSKTVDLSVAKASDVEGSPVDITLTEGKFTFQSVRSETYEDFASDGKIGYIRITNFYENTEEQFLEEYNKLEANNVGSYIFDLRYNSSGDFNVAISILKKLVPKKSFGYFHKKDKKDEFIGDNSLEFEKEIVVLVNSITASQSELFALTLKNHKNAQIVGIKTAGKDSVQKMFEISSDHSAIRFSVGYITLNNEETWAETGVKPDFEVLLDDPSLIGVVPLEMDEDFQLKKALEILTKQDKNAEEDETSNTPETSSTE